MNPFDDNPQPPSHIECGDQPITQESPSATPLEDSLENLSSRIVVHQSEEQPGRPAAPELPSAEPPPPLAPPPAPPPPSFLPEDLRISWSWVHLTLFAFFAIGSIIAIQVALVIYYAAGRHLSQKELEELFTSRPEVAVGSNVLWFFLIFLFLYVTLAVLRDRPFWPTLGWKKLGLSASAPSNPWAYFGGGIALAIMVAIVSSRIKTPDHLPIQDLFKNRTGAMLLMAMAVLVAPLVEETVFRGYLYPLFASTTSRIASGFGADPAVAISTGTTVGIVVTGILFGFLHGAQLGWTWGLVAMLSTVGIIFTFARARAGTVVASFLLHLGYNSMIAVSAIVSTKGFTVMPPHP